MNDLNIANSEHKKLTLEEMDILCRKCHHLHDEEILNVIVGVYAKLRKFFVQKNNELHAGSGKVI